MISYVPWDMARVPLLLFLVRSTSRRSGTPSDTNSLHALCMIGYLIQHTIEARRSSPNLYFAITQIRMERSD